MGVDDAKLFLTTPRRPKVTSAEVGEETGELNTHTYGLSVCLYIRTAERIRHNPGSVSVCHAISPNAATPNARQPTATAVLPGVSAAFGIVLR